MQKNRTRVWNEERGLFFSINFPVLACVRGFFFFLFFKTCLFVTSFELVGISQVSICTFTRMDAETLGAGHRGNSVGHVSAVTAITSNYF